MEELLFLDIETVPAHGDFDSLDQDWKKLWAKKAQFFISDESDEATREAYHDRAGIFSEFGKVIVIGIGFFPIHENGKREFRVKSIYNDNEVELLREFNEIVEQMKKPNLTLVAHNGKEFDFPYLSRRMLVNKVPLPRCLDNSGKKPWEIPHLDTMEMWKFGDRKNFTSLDLLAKIFNVPSSKSDIDGSMVAEVYYKENDLQRIADYCTEDVVVCAQVFLALKGLETLKPEEILRR